MTDQALDLSKYIEKRHTKQRPYIRGQHVAVATVAYGRHHLGMGISQLMREYALSEAEVLAALLYYIEHQAEIDADEQAYIDSGVDDWIFYGDDNFLPG
jgi:uncharacterized protein (DUF433 family)